MKSPIRTVVNNVVTPSPSNRFRSCLCLLLALGMFGLTAGANAAISIPPIADQTYSMGGDSTTVDLPTSSGGSGDQEAKLTLQGGGALPGWLTISRHGDGANRFIRMMINPSHATAVLGTITLTYRREDFEVAPPAGVASRSFMVTVTEAVIVPPDAPTGLSATSSADGTTVTLTWTAPADDGGTDISGYSIQRAVGTLGFASLSSHPAAQTRPTPTTD